MADEEQFQERTEQATPKRQEQLREQGHFLRSKEWSTLLVVMSSFIGLIIYKGAIAEHFKVLITQIFTLKRNALFHSDTMVLTLMQALKSSILLLVPFFALVMACVVGGSMLVGGAHFSQSALAPKWSRLNVFSGLKRIFSVNSLMELLKSCIKVTLVLFIAYLVISSHWQGLLALTAKRNLAAFEEAFAILQDALLFMGLALVLVSFIDIPYQFYKHIQESKMTKQEIRDEYKETEGKPEVKGRIRQLQREVAKRRMMSKIAEADAVIANPEHFAVAVKYDRGTMRAPIVVAKGRDLIALKIKEKAKEHHVALIEAPPLARALYYSTELDEPIPGGLYVAVAQVLAYIYQLKRFEKGEVFEKPVLKNLPIPDELKR